MTQAQIYADPDGIVVNAIESDGHNDTLGSLYQILLQGLDGKPAGVSHIEFQQGALNLVGRNGITNETLLAILIHRTEAVNLKVPSAENEEAIVFMKHALKAFQRRTAERKARGVQGTMKA